MRKNYWSIVSVILPFYLQAQVTVNVQLPPGGMVQKDQLWNLVLINNNAEIADATLSLDLQDAATGQTVLSAGSRSFILGKGIKVINPRDVQPVQFNYIAAELSGNFIPLGTYVACYRLVSNTVKGPQPAGDECLKIHINPLSPPLLATPADRSVLETPYPQFSWLPPTPSEMFSNLQYDIAVSEILPGQTAAEAILYNTPVYTRHSIKVPFESYPSSFSSLKQGQSYAWQVVAKNGLNYAVQTETWSFAIQATDSVAAPAIGDGFALLRPRNSNSGIAVITNRKLQLKHYSFDPDQKVTIRIFSDEGQLVMESAQLLQYGDNFLTMDLPRKISSGKTYLAEMKDARGDVYQTRFIIKDNQQTN